MFDSIAKNWQAWNPGAPLQATSINNGGNGQGQMGFGGLDDGWLKSVGFNGPATINTGNNTDGGSQADQTNPALAQWLQSNGYNLQAANSDQTGMNYGRLVDGGGNQVGDTKQWQAEPDNAFGLAMLAASGFAGASAAGAFGGSGAFGSGAASGGASGGGLAGTDLPAFSAYGGQGSAGYGLAGDVAAAPAGALSGTEAAGSGIGMGGGSFGAGALDSAGGAGFGSGLGAAGSYGGTAAGGGGLLSQLGSAAGDVGSWAKSNPGLVNVGGSLVNGLTGYLSASNALSAQKDATGQANALWAPYREAGNNAVGKLNGLMQNPGSITSDPGYAFGMNQGTQAIDRSAASNGGLYSGATLKALDRYGTDYGGTKLNDAYSRYGGVAQLGATGTTNTSNDITNLGNAGAASSLYTGNVLQQGTNNALANFNQSNGQSTYGGGYPWNYPGQRP
jgi:hypothetical protein